jgi:microfibrillar-associated protein 1
MSTQAARKQAPRLARPAARYWKGKAPKGIADVDSDSDVEEVPQMEEEGDVPMSGDQDIVEEGDEEEATRLRMEAPKSLKAMNVTLNDVSISKDGRVIVAGREESGRTALEEDGALMLLLPILSR